MKTSSGILIHDNDYLLMGHSNGNDFFDIPKGVINKNEDHLDTMIRETHEEFNIDVDKFLPDIRLLGTFDYSSYKNLVLYELKCDYLALRENTLFLNSDSFNLKCSSYFTINNKTRLEMDSYALIDIRSIPNNTCNSFQNMIYKYNLLT